MNAELTRDELEQAVWARETDGGLVQHSDRGSECLVIRCSGDVEPSAGSVGDAYNNVLAESIIGLHKVEVIRPLGPWCSIDAVEYVTLQWAEWYSDRRLLEPIGSILPLESEKACSDGVGDTTPAAGLHEDRLGETRSGYLGDDPPSWALDGRLLP